jgi:uncharacterized protein YuzE
MIAKLTVRYDREADVLRIDARPPYAEQVEEELGKEALVRLNPETGEVEGVEIPAFSRRLGEGGEPLELPLTGELHMAANF